jgi:maltose/moltooligosaccharide transporter
MEHWLHDNRLMAVVLGGFFLIVAALIMPFVRVPEQATEQVSDQLTDQVQTDAADSNANGSTDSDQVGEPVAS